MLYKNRNDRETPEFYPQNISRISRGFLKANSEESNLSVILLNSSFEVTPTGAIVDIGASVPMVSRCALDEFKGAIKNDYPELYQRILYTDTSVKMNAANGGKIEAMQQDCVPVKLDLSKNWAFTSFAIAELGRKHVPFLFSLPHVLNLDAIIDTTPNRECMISRKTGYAYKLRKPRGHLLLDLVNPPMRKLESFPQRISIGSNWTYKNYKNSESEEQQKQHFP